MGGGGTYDGSRGPGGGGGGCCEVLLLLLELLLPVESLLEVPQARTIPSLRYLSGLNGSPSVSKSSQAFSSTISCLTGNISESLSFAECVESSLLGVLGVSNIIVGVTAAALLVALDAPVKDGVALLLTLLQEVVAVEPTASKLSRGRLGLVPKSLLPVEPALFVAPDAAVALEELFVTAQLLFRLGESSDGEMHCNTYSRKEQKKLLTADPLQWDISIAYR